jgi:hypothetical protein
VSREINIIPRLVLIAFLTVLLSVLSTVTGAEEVGAIKGTVVDAKAAHIPGAKVKLTQQSSGHETEVTTDETGAFSFDNQPAGDYILTAIALGFKLAERKLTVATTPAPPVQISLEVLQVTEKLTVSADAIPVSPEQNADRFHVDDNFLSSLPMVNGDPLSVVSIFTDPSLAGAMGPQLIVDGIPTDSLDLPLSSIKSISVNENPYSAEFGRPGKGRIEVKTKRRIHQFHGTVFTDFLNSAFDARDPFASSVPLHQRSVSEAELEGPISKAVTFLVSGRYDLNNETAVVDAQKLSGPLVRNFGAPERNTHLFERLIFKLSTNHKLSLTHKFKHKSRKNQNVGAFDLPERATNYLDHENEFDLFETATPSPALLNEFRLAYRQRRQDTSSITDQPAILVPDAFQSGGAQASIHLRDFLADAEDIATWSHGKHTLRFGGGVRPRWIRAVNASNFGGTFVFSCLFPIPKDPLDPLQQPCTLAFSQNMPAQFTQNIGNPQVSFAQHEFYSFVQDELRLRPKLSLVLGLRHEGQSNGNHFHNVAPRLAIAYAPGSARTVIRAGFGVFYDRQPEVMEQQALLYNGNQIQQIVIPNPSFPNPIPPGTTVTSAAGSLVRISPDMTFPYLFQGNFEVERKLGKGENYFSVDLTTVRGVHLYRMRDINAPLPGTGVRPNPSILNLDQFESAGSSRSNSMTLALRLHPRRNFSFYSQYILSRSMDDTSGIYFLPANNFDLHSEWGRSDFDRRHQFNFIGTYDLPRGFRVGAVGRIASGIPFNITTGLDANGDTVFNDRQPGVTRNTGHGPGYANLDLHFGKIFRLKGRDHNPKQFELAVDAFNALNHVNYKNYVGIATSPFFGQPNHSADPARSLQLSLKFTF